MANKNKGLTPHLFPYNPLKRAKALNPKGRDGGSEKRGKAKAIIMGSAKKERRYRELVHAQVQPLIDLGVATKCKSNGSFYIVGEVPPGMEIKLPPYPYNEK